MTKVKICGITSVPDALASIEAGADFIGMILSDSPRQASLESVMTICTSVRAAVATVGVFAKRDDLLAFDSGCNVTLDYYQTYFPPEQNLRRQPTLGWIRSYMIEKDQQEISCDTNGLLLCDFKEAGFDKIEQLRLPLQEWSPNRVILAGNLTVGNVADVVERYRPFGVDVARGTEKVPGIKDHQLLKQFVREAKYAGC